MKIFITAPTKDGKEKYCDQIAKIFITCLKADRKKQAAGLTTENLSRFFRKTIKITISLGIAGYEKGITDIRDFIRRADQALYRAKQTGRDRTELWTA